MHFSWLAGFVKHKSVMSKKDIFFTLADICIRTYTSVQVQEWKLSQPTCEKTNIFYKTNNISCVKKKSSSACNSCTSLCKSRNSFHSQEMLVMMSPMTLEVTLPD